MPRAHSVRRATLFTSGGRVFTRTKNIVNIGSLALGVWKAGINGNHVLVYTELAL